MGSPEILNALRNHRQEFQSVMNDLYTMYNPWNDNNPWIRSAHLDLDVVTSAPGAGELAQGEVVLGDGTGPNSRDEVFWSTDGSTVARVEADAIIT